MEVVAVVGRKTNSSSAVDKMKRKKKKKKRSKEGKRSSASGVSANRTPDSAGRLKPHKSCSSLSCPPDLSQPTSRNSSDGDTDGSFNETLRWLPVIARHSGVLPPAANNCRMHGPTVSRLNSNSLTETVEEEEERIAIYKMNRRKRYLAAQQALVELYPDNKVYAADDPIRPDMRRLPNKTPIFPTPPTEILDSSNKTSKYELAIPSFVHRQDKAMVQKVI